MLHSTLILVLLMMKIGLGYLCAASYPNPSLFMMGTALGNYVPYNYPTRIPVIKRNRELHPVVGVGVGGKNHTMALYMHPLLDTPPPIPTGRSWATGAQRQRPCQSLYNSTSTALCLAGPVQDLP